MKLASKLPEGDRNGLPAIARDLINSPHDVHIVLALIDCKSIATDTDSGDVVPTARIRWIETITEDRPHLMRIIARAQEVRTGKAVLPMEMEDEIRLLLDGIDPATGETTR